MIPLIDFQKRSLNGPVMKPDDFDLGFSMKVREVVEKYDIKRSPEEIVADESVGDAVFKAGVDVLADVGLYHFNTQRVVRYTEEEILEFVRERYDNPGEATFGKGPDEMTIAYRTADSKQPAVLYSGIGGAITEDEFLPLLKSFAGERRIKGLGISGGITKVGDVEPKAGTLSEIHCGLWEQEQLQRILEEVGRPDMNLGLLCTVSTVGATMQCLDRGFRGPHNTQIGVHIIPEQKIDWDRLRLAHFCRDRGIVPWQSAMSLIGGLCRNGADAAVGMMANVLGQMSYAKGPTCSLFPAHLDGTWSTRESIWAVSAAMRASERNIRIAIGSGTVASYQWTGTFLGMIQQAAQALAYTASGFSYSWLGGASPFEAVMCGEAMEAAAAMGPEKAKALAMTVMDRIDELIKEEKPRPAICTFKDVYDLETVEPKPGYQSDLDRARKELERLGVAN